MAASESTLTILVQLRDQASEQLKGFSGNLQKLQPQINQLAVLSGAAFAGITAAIGFSVSAAAEAEVKVASLGATLQAMGGSMAGVSDYVLAAAKSFVQLGFDDEAAAQSMAFLFQRTGDVTQAMKLTGLAADLARAKHLDLETATRLVALALSGQGRALVQYGIIIKDTASPLEALGILQEKVGGQAKAFADTFSGKVSEITETVGNLREAIGNAFLPILKKMADTIVPIAKALTDFTNQHGMMIAAVLGSVAVILGATTAMLGFLAVYLKLKPAIDLATAALARFGLALGAIAAPVAIVVAAFLAMTYAADKWKNGVQEGIDVNMDYAGKLNALQTSLENLHKPIEKDTEAMKKMAEQMDAANKKITEVQKSIASAIKDSTDSQVSYNEDKAKIFVDQEQKVADLKTQIAEKTADLQRELASESSATQIQSTQQELAELQTKLGTEQLALASFQQYSTDIQAQLTEMRRRAGETEFQNALETLMRQRVAELTTQKEKLEALVEELNAAKVQKASLLAIEVQFTADWKKQEDERLAKAAEITGQIVSLMAQRSAAATGASVQMQGSNYGSTISSSYMSAYGGGGPTIKSVKDAIITPRGDVIRTDPADFLIATKNPGGVGGVTVNIYGDVTGTELIEKVKEGLMRALRLDTKFAIS